MDFINNKQVNILKTIDGKITVRRIVKQISEEKRKKKRKICINPHNVYEEIYQLEKDGLVEINKECSMIITLTKKGEKARHYFMEIFKLLEI